MPVPYFGGLSDADRQEPILQPNANKYCTLPITHAAVWEMYKKAEASFWTGEHVYSHVSSHA